MLDEETYEINRSYTAIKRSIYIRHLQRWLQYFPRSQIHIVDGDNMIGRPWEELSKVGIRWLPVQFVSVAMCQIKCNTT